MRKSLGDKRREISPAHIQQLTGLVQTLTGNEQVKLFPTYLFGYRKITIERPLRLNFQASPERIERLCRQNAFKALAESNKKNVEMKALEETAGRQQQAAWLCCVR